MEQSPPIGPDAALLVVDVQAGFDDPAWGERNNPAADENIATLVDAFAAGGRPIVLVRHDSADPTSPLHPSSAGNRFKAYLDRDPDLLVTKSVNSCFHGEPDLHAWLRQRDLTVLVIAGITTNHCCETTARLAGNLGYDVRFVLDATHTFDRTGPDGTRHPADDLAAVTAANLHGEFATVCSTADVVRALGSSAN